MVKWHVLNMVRSPKMMAIPLGGTDSPSHVIGSSYMTSTIYNINYLGGMDNPSRIIDQVARVGEFEVGAG